jgi:hypothetical protein
MPFCLFNKHLFIQFYYETMNRTDESWVVSVPEGNDIIVEGEKLLLWCSRKDYLPQNIEF